MRSWNALASLVLIALPAVQTKLADGTAHKQPAPIDVCKMVPAKVVKAVPGVGSYCTVTPPQAGPGSTDYVGTWTDKPAIAKSGKGGIGPQISLEVTIARYTDKGVLKLAVQNLDQGLPGPPVAVKGLGGPAYEAKGYQIVAVHIAWKSYVAYVGLTSARLPQSSPKVLYPLAKVLTETF
jgi:hypothetical protein